LQQTATNLQFITKIDFFFETGTPPKGHPLSQIHLIFAYALIHCTVVERI
jgi:hypothetical protein